MVDDLGWLLSWFLQSKSLRKMKKWLMYVYNVWLRCVACNHDWTKTLVQWWGSDSTSKKIINNTQILHVWYMYLYIYLENEPNVGKHAKHGAFGMLSSSPAMGRHQDTLGGPFMTFVMGENQDWCPWSHRHGNFMAVVSWSEIPSSGEPTTPCHAFPTRRLCPQPCWYPPTINNH